MKLFKQLYNKIKSICRLIVANFTLWPDKLPESNEGKFVEKLLIVLVIDPDKENIPVSLLAHGTSYSKYKVTVLEP